MRVQWFFVIKNVAFIPFQMNRGCDNKNVNYRLTYAQRGLS